MTGKMTGNTNVLYITTPTNTYEKDADWVVASRTDLLEQGFKVTIFDIKDKTSREVANAVSKNDVVWVSGGNVFYFLYYAEKVGLKKILVDFLSKNGIYAGESAGVVCQIKDLEPIKWADHPEKAPELVKEGMQLTDLVVLPHWNDEKYGGIMEKIQAYYKKRRIKVHTIEDGQALVVDGGKIEFVEG